MCNEHPNGNQIGPEHPVGATCTNSPYLFVQTIVDCPDSGGGTGDTGGTGGGAPADGGSASGGPTSPTGPSLPEVEDDVIIRPCNKIKAQNTKFPSLRQSLITLSGTTSQNYENGIFIDNTATTTTINPVQTIPSNTSNGGTIPINMTPTNSYVMIAHTHDSYGSTGNGTYSIFSWDDLASINSLIKNNHIDNTVFVFYVITADGTRYAITVDKPSKLSSIFYNIDEAVGTVVDPEKIKIMNKNFNKYYNTTTNGLIKTNTNKDDDKLNFLKFIEEADLGISLFQVDETFTTYEKLSLSSNKTSVIPVPCN